MMSGIEGYDTGGVIHIIVNNQIGFTANPKDSRSTLYCSEVAKVIGAPIIHVNGDDIEAVVQAMKILTEFKEKFKIDVFLDICCYRKYGHNE
jgi:2-oxoglutarate dehydrogenase E1 component